jgi:hypothetical protein
LPNFPAPHWGWSGRLPAADFHVGRALGRPFENRILVANGTVRRRHRRRNKNMLTLFWNQKCVILWTSCLGRQLLYRTAAVRMPTFADFFPSEKCLTSPGGTRVCLPETTTHFGLLLLLFAIFIPHLTPLSYHLLGP